MFLFIEQNFLRCVGGVRVEDKLTSEKLICNVITKKNSLVYFQIYNLKHNLEKKLVVPVLDFIQIS